VQVRLQIPWDNIKKLYDKKLAAFVKMTFHAITAKRGLMYPITTASHPRHNKGEMQSMKAVSKEVHTEEEERLGVVVQTWTAAEHSRC